MCTPHHHHHFTLLFITLLTIITTTTTSSSLPPSDAVALLKFKLKADTKNKLLYNLNEHFDYCQWQGVKCVQGRVVRLVLQNITLVGSFPLSLTTLHRLKSIDLARNGLYGSLPIELNFLDKLTYLRLEWNRFFGSIPPLNQTGLNVFNVSGNNLTGSIPETLVRFGVESYLYNPNLCGKIVNRICDGKAPFFDAGAGVGVSGPTPAGGNAEAQGLVMAPPDTRRRHKRVGVILGFVIGFLIVLAFVLSVFAVFGRRKRVVRAKSVEFSSDEEENENENVNGIENRVVTISANDISNEVRILNNEIAMKVKEKKMELPQQHREKSGNLIFCEGEAAMYGLEQLMSASAELLGRGTIGTTYKAVMGNQLIVTVKRLDAGKTAITSGEAFEKHLEAVGGLRHPNLVPVRAYFQAKQERLVIYDYQPNGSLFNLIHGSRSAKAKPLHWTSCLKIAEDIALGLAYIHQASRLIHNNLKSSNVLLGPDFEACLTDYCLLVLADPTSIDESISTGYKAPELRKSFHRATTKSDVYAFGVLLLELLSGRPPSQHPHLVPEDMAEWVRAMRENDDMPNDNRLGMLVEVAGVCSLTSPEQRPVMRQVLKMLQEIKEAASMDTDNTYNGYS
ncbi:probable inactive receptor kinase [Tanacetum coccineum]|uniref:Probable inactive receptor kinase n=1 Tax=Tanacetum coccineum TaxID=301880 RepID=A0ABQ5EMH0_9ASTR